MTRALIYCRCSPRPEECESIQVQADYCERYFAFQKIAVGAVIFDNETSARLVPLEERKGGAQLLALTTGKNPEYSIVGAYRLDRLWRDVVDGNITLRAWRRAGVACHFAAEGGQSINTATATGRFIVNVLLSKAEFEPDLTAERTSDAMLRHQKNGRPMSKDPPHGKQLCNGALVDSPAELAVMVRIQADHTRGLGYREIARRLNAEGVPCRGKMWYASSVREICLRSTNGQ